MKNLKIIVVLLLINANCIAQTGGLHKLLTDSLNVIQTRIAKVLKPARYMEGKLITQTTDFDGWKGINISLYEYSVDKGTKTGRVYMANADAIQLAKWVISTCYELTENLTKKNTDFLIKSFIGASGGQFPVQGVVYENMDGKGYKAYYFLNGVTVFLNNRTITNLFDANNITGAGQYARIISTTREQYNAKFPEVNTQGMIWLEVVKAEYQAALKSDKNNLMIAWASGKLD